MYTETEIKAADTAIRQRFNYSPFFSMTETSVLGMDIILAEAREDVFHVVNDYADRVLATPEGTYRSVPMTDDELKALKRAVARVGATARLILCELERRGA